MNYTDASIELIELLSCLVFDESGQIGFFESEHRVLDLASIIFWMLTKILCVVRYKRLLEQPRKIRMCDL